jgi:hypothetical protein
MVGVKAFVILLIAALFISISSCNNSVGDIKLNNKMRDTAVYEWVRIKTPDSIKSILEIEYQSPKFIYPKEISDKINSLLFFNKDTSISIIDVDEFKKNTLLYYYEIASENNYTSEISSSFPYIINSFSYVHLNNDNIISISKKSYWYTGGAHGNTKIEYYNFLIKENKLLSLDDVFKSKNELKHLILKKLKDNYKIPSKSDISKHNFFENDSSLRVCDNFLLTDSNIIFTYNTYDIAPYVMGAISISIPNSEFKDILNPNYNFIIK